MSVLSGDYLIIAPQKKYLTDVVVLSQAWKKTHKYIRHHNWFADVLELDCSTIDLENELKKWSDAVKRSRYKPQEMSPVPAPKNSRWIFQPADTTLMIKGAYWEPEEKQKLRPLAHLSIRDQTLATAVMLCLADAVESIQGPSEEDDFMSAQRQKIYSYGNRLQCDWEFSPERPKRARFGWGNSQSYRKFYEDYELFLLRPKQICQRYASNLSPTKNLFVVSLDLQGFFDNIDIDACINQLELIYQQYVTDYDLDSTYHSDQEFWTLVRRIFNWRWKSHSLAHLFDSNKLPEGLPQGGVVSGFLSNAYMVNFDKSVGEMINKDNDDIGFVLRDYCRYVDDIRLVVEVDEATPVEVVKHIVIKRFEQYLQEHLENIGAKKELKFNQEKTQMLHYRKLSTQNNVSSMMTLFQGILSGTPDIDSLEEVSGGLDGLLNLSNQLKVESEENPKFVNKLKLAYLASPNVDVRDDTIKRFVATRIVKTLRFRRSMTDLQELLGKKESVLEHVTAGQLLDQEFETTARKLISCWADNPALTLLLRWGFDLYPDPILLGPVLEAIEYKLFSKESSVEGKEIKAIEYTIADLFRSGAVEIGYRPRFNYPSSADIDAFRQELGSFAKRIIKDRPKSPWYLIQQAALYLASVGDFIDLPKGKKSDRLEQYRLLHDTLLYRSIDSKGIAVALIAQQMTPDPKRFSQWFVESLREKDDNQCKQLVNVVTMNRPDLILEIWKVSRLEDTTWKKYLPKNIRPLLQPKFQQLNGQDISLQRIIQCDENPFAQENALLLLALEILKVDNIEKKLAKGLSVDAISVECKNWSQIQFLKRSGGFLNVDLKDTGESDERFGMPIWVNKKHYWLYSFGRILRSCITGEYDFTATTFLSREDIGRYTGLRSTWYTRRFGLLNSPSGLLKDQNPVSPWLSELLIRLLQWPGIEVDGSLIKEFEKVHTAKDLAALIDNRIKHQYRFFGKLSGTPVYELPTSSGSNSDNKIFRVAVVQTLMPKMDDFNDKEPTHWTTSYRARHRAHIASVCNLIRKKLKTWCHAQQSSETQAVDLIVFPELSIHPDDLWLLRRLSDATKASIFAGMTFIQSSFSEDIINQAVWILRSERRTGRELVEVRQGKQHMTKTEQKLKVQGHRPYQLVVEFKKKDEVIRVAGAICYDSTDLELVSDLREVSDIFVVAALNKDVQTFDNMVSALQYHMYQPVILANTGEFGGSTAQAPFANQHDRLIAHVHGNNQVAISVFEFDPTVFKTLKKPPKSPKVKTAPAGYKGRV